MSARHNRSGRATAQSLTPANDPNARAKAVQTLDVPMTADTLRGAVAEAAHSVAPAAIVAQSAPVMPALGDTNPNVTRMLAGRNVAELLYGSAIAAGFTPAAPDYVLRDVTPRLSMFAKWLQPMSYIPAPAAKNGKAHKAPTVAKSDGGTIALTHDAVHAAIENMLAASAIAKTEPRLSVHPGEIRLQTRTERWVVKGENAAALVAETLSDFAYDTRWMSSGTKDGWQTCVFLLRRDAHVEVAKRHLRRTTSAVPRKNGKSATVIDETALRAAIDADTAAEREMALEAAEMAA